MKTLAFIIVLFAATSIYLVNSAERRADQCIGRYEQ